ncbi:MAG: hypothetical protein ACK504_01535 [Bacteroidota bacterium]
MVKTTNHGDIFLLISSIDLAVKFPTLNSKWNGDDKFSFQMSLIFFTIDTTGFNKKKMIKVEDLKKTVIYN